METVAGFVQLNLAVPRNATDKAVSDVFTTVKSYLSRRTLGPATAATGIPSYYSINDKADRLTIFRQHLAPASARLPLR
jgi:hypothetical protein